MTSHHEQRQEMRQLADEAPDWVLRVAYVAIFVGLILWAIQVVK